MAHQVRLVLSEEQWARIEGLIAGKPGDRGTTGRDNRMFVEGVLWLARTGAPWRDLPCVFGEWNSVYQRFSRWSKSGVWERVFRAIAEDPDFEYVMIDATIVRAHQHAAGAKKAKTTRERIKPRSKPSGARAAV